MRWFDCFCLKFQWPLSCVIIFLYLLNGNLQLLKRTISSSTWHSLPTKDSAWGYLLDWRPSGSSNLCCFHPHPRYLLISSCVLSSLSTDGSLLQSSLCVAKPFRAFRDRHRQCLWEGHQWNTTWLFCSESTEILFSTIPYRKGRYSWPVWHRYPCWPRGLLE